MAAAVQDFARQVFSDETDQLEFLALLLAPGLLESTQVAEAVRRILTSALHRTLIVYGRNFDRVYQTLEHHLQIVCFQMAFAKVLCQVRRVLEEEGLAVQVVSSDGHGRPEEDSCSAPAASWMDDLAVPVQAANPGDLIGHAGRTLQVIDSAISRVGVSLNFGAGKTEFLPVLCGPGSRAAREEPPGRSGGAPSVALPKGIATVSLARSYVHLGAVVGAAASDLPDIRRRAALAREMSVSMRKLLSNPHLRLAEKSTFKASMPLARLRHGAGLWTVDTEQTRQAYHTAYMEILRRSFRQVTGVTSKGRSDWEICYGLQALHPDEARAVDLIRHAGWLLAVDSGILREFWLKQSSWKIECLLALRLLEPILCQDASSLWHDLVQDPSLAKPWARRLSKICRRRNSELGDLLLPPWRSQQAATRAGWIFCRLPDASENLLGEYACTVCRKFFRSSAALASHASRAHGKTAEAALATCGLCCEICSREYWTTQGLHQHMRQRSPFRRICCLHPFVVKSGGLGSRR